MSDETDNIKEESKALSNEDETSEESEAATGESADQEEKEKTSSSHHTFQEDVGSEYRWYVVHALSGHELRVLKALKERITKNKLTEYFAEILVPQENVLTNVSGKKRNIKKKFFPGYILIKMVMNDKTWHLIKHTDKITGFLGGNKGAPTPISDEEASYITDQAARGFKQDKSSLKLNEGDSVRVIEGPFASFVGTVETINEKGKLKVNVSIFGRPTPVELDMSQVEKA